LGNDRKEFFFSDEQNKVAKCKFTRTAVLPLELQAVKSREKTKNEEARTNVEGVLNLEVEACSSI
jgi:hypothetical protein